MKEIVIGTAGHIDHGKTALVQALTGINTDRLKEEKLRGITIELGFANLVFPSGIRAGIVDVPGHERFVKAMVAGATGIDIVILVIAADEGVMPQTREHLDICRLLRIKKGLVALTKTDLVDEEWLHLVEEDISEFVRGTFLEGSPVVHTSAVSGKGIDELLQILDRLSGDLEPRHPSQYFRLPIDRVFVMKGFGTVITGTLQQGEILEGDGVEVAPKGIRSKIRGLQVHGLSVKESHAGMRTAVNLQGLGKDDVQRGDVLIPPDSLRPSHMVDARLEYLANAPRKMKNRTRVRFHIGTSEILARVMLMDKEEIEPGDSAFVQFRLEAPAVALYGDTFVIRSYSPIQTVGGGVILDGLPVKHHRYNEKEIDHFRGIGRGDLPGAALKLVESKGIEGLNRRELNLRFNVSEKRLDEIIADPAFAEKVTRLESELPGTVKSKSDDVHFISSLEYERLLNSIVTQLGSFHSENPLEPGISRDDLRWRCKIRTPVRGFPHALQQLAENGEIVAEGDRWRLKSHRLDLGKEQQEHISQITDIFLKAALQPPALKTVSDQIGLSEKDAKNLADLLVRQGDLVKVKEGLYFHARELQSLQDRMVTFLDEKNEITPPDFKEMTGLSRKYMIPLLEYFDRIKITMRVGDKRVKRR